MTRRMQRYRGGAERYGNAIVHGCDGRIAAQALLRDAKSRTCENVIPAAGPQMVCVAMRDDRGAHGLPGIDVEIPRRAVEPLCGDGDERFGIRAHE